MPAPSRPLDRQDRYQARLVVAASGHRWPKLAKGGLEDSRAPLQIGPIEARDGWRAAGFVLARPWA